MTPSPSTQFYPPPVSAVSPLPARAARYLGSHDEGFHACLNRVEHAVRPLNIFIAHGLGKLTVSTYKYNERTEGGKLAIITCQPPWSCKTKE